MRLTQQRWLVVAALYTITFGVANPFAAFGVFLPVLAEEFGWSRGAMLSVHIVPFARDQGIGLGTAALALTAYGLGAAAGRLVFGAGSDRLAAQITMRVSFAL
ncbi:MAG: hypothetical protein ACREKS_14960 [Candidatus Rokuibacteriota bacterium]